VVPSDYDSLLAKVIAHGRDRDEARTRLVRAVAATRLAGVADNAAWLGRALRTEAFAAGGVTTRFLAEQSAALAAPATVPEVVLQAAAQAVLEAPRRAADGVAGRVTVGAGRCVPREPGGHRAL
jgi:acetyl/propionyl-CoA carboxylase alpha subunit